MEFQGPSTKNNYLTVEKYLRVFILARKPSLSKE